MKKILLGILGLSAVLTSCGGDDYSSDLGIQRDSLTLTSNYVVNDLNFLGTHYSGPVICDNLTTNLRFDFDYFGDLDRVNLRLRGDKTGQITPLTSDPSRATFNGGHGRVDFYANSGTVPLSLPIKPQSIVVSPVVSGATYVELQGVNSDGDKTAYVPSNMLPVIDNCQ